MGRIIHHEIVHTFNFSRFQIVQDKTNNNMQIRGMSVSRHASLRNASSQSQTNLTTKPYKKSSSLHTNQVLNF